MPVESPINFISDLVITNPVHTDGLAQADAHLRGIKTALKATFPNITGVVSPTQTDLSNGFVPIGGIIMWQGSVATIPANWHLCDGTSGTVDLRDKFVIGAGDLYTPGTTGGSTSYAGQSASDGAHTHQSTATSSSASSSTSNSAAVSNASSVATSSASSSSTSTSDTQGAHVHSGSSALGHSLTTAEIPSHTHDTTFYVTGSDLPGGIGQPLIGAYSSSLGPSSVATDGGTGLAGTPSAHTHGLSLVSDGSHSHNISTTTTTTVSTAVTTNCFTEVVTNTSTNTATNTVVTTPASSDSAHIHNVSVSGLPPYYALAFIQRIT